MRNFLLTFFSATLLFACSQNNSSPDRAGFITLLGNDTLAVEKFEKTENGMQARVVLRTPRTTLTSYELELDDSGGIRQLTSREYDPTQGFSGEGSVIGTVEKAGDSLLVEMETDEGARRESAPYAEGVLPFIDMVHWPFELAFNHAAESPRDSISQQLLTGGRLSNFIIAKIDSDSMTIRHPFRGVMGVTVDENGDLLHLDAGLTTRKLKVHRVSEVDIDAIGRRFAAGGQFGELSGAESADFSFRGTDFHVEYGSPSKRGRTLFGGIVPWGERWRTGANRATHFRTSSDLRIGDLPVPAGEYTLFTIPEPDGGTMMINKQTGQNGQSYDESRDLGRVPMEISTKPDITEQFTIQVEETDTGGVLKLIWGETVYSVDFEIVS